MKIRKATVKNAALIARINSLSGDPVDKILGIKESWIRNSFKKSLHDKRFEAFLFEDKGVAVLKKDFSGFNNCELDWLTVDKKYQGKGIGKKLVNFVEARARKLKFRGIYTYTHPIHKPAMKFYKKLGFKKINEFPDYYSNGDKSILFGKLLK